MTVTRHGVSGTQPNQPPGTAAPGAPPGYGSQYGPPTARRIRGLTAAVAAAILLAVAALVVGIIDLTRPTTPAGSAPATTTPITGPTADTTEADRALCTAIAPLMRENDQIAKAYIALGSVGSPQREAGTSKYVNDVREWVKRIQPIVDSKPAVDAFFRRSLQRFIDDQRLLVADLAAGPYQTYDDTIWADSLGAYSGPLSICYNLGIKW